MWAEVRGEGLGLGWVLEGLVVVVVEEEGSMGERRRPKRPRLLSSMGWKSMRARRPP